MNCITGEGWRKSVEPIVLEMKKCYLDRVNKESNIIYTVIYSTKDEGLTGLVKSCLRTAFYNTLSNKR
jgi:hypothetical protein